MRLWRAATIVCWIASALPPACAQSPSGEEAKAIEDVAFVARCDESTQRYVLIYPKGFRADQPCNMLVALHGHGSDRWQYMRNPRDECRSARDIAAARGMLVVSPDYRGKTSWRGPKAEADLAQIIDELKSRFKIGKVILCGGSMGGSSVLTFAALHPEQVDGAASMNGTATREQ